MKKVFILEDLDCAHCASKIEEEVGKIGGVSGSSVALLTQKLTVEYDDSMVDDLYSQVKKIVKKYEPDVEVLAKS